MALWGLVLPGSRAAWGFTFVLFGIVPAFAADPAELILRNGKIYTADSSRSIGQSLAVRGNTIVAVGTDADMVGLMGPGTRIIDLAGKFVMPGIIDGHIHPIFGATNAAKCSLAGVPATMAAITPVVRKCLAERPGGDDSWLEVVMLDNYGFSATAADIDTIEATRPLLIGGSDGHSLWTNSRGLALAGVTAQTPDPPGGMIARDASGSPIGVFSDNATELVQKLVPPLSAEERARLTEQALAGLAARGITALTDAAVSPAEAAVWQTLYRSGHLKQRVRTALFIENPDDDSDEAVARIVAQAKSGTLDPDRLRADEVKIFADGVIEHPAQTAALLTPYLDAEGQPTANFGKLYFEPAHFDNLVTKLDKMGITVHIHAIGDRAVRASLDAFAAARKANGPSSVPHQIAHLQLVDPTDRRRFAELGVIANMQLQWAMRDPSNIGPLEPYLGPERYSGLYPARSLKMAGARISGGSDWPVSSYDPFLAMEHGLSRSERGKNYGTLNAAESLSISDMIAAYTINAAIAMGQDKIIGSLEPGKRADFVILDRNLLETPTEAIEDTQVLATYIDGAPIYQK